MTFPPVQGQTVSGKRRRLPTDFAAPFSVVLLGFTQEQQHAVDGWLPHLEVLAADHPALAIYEVAVVRPVNMIERAMLDYWMRSGIRDPATRDRTITLYTDVVAFLRALNLRHTGTTYTLLVDQAGTVHWLCSGRYTNEKRDTLQQKLTRLMEERV